MACDIDELIAAATCIECKVPAGMQMAALITVMCEVAQGGGPPVDTNFRITTDDDDRVTTDGDNRVWI